MANWSQLPLEILTLIANRLETPFDVLRFRSVCPLWRSSCPPKAYTLPRYPILPSVAKGRFDCSLSCINRNTFFLVRLAGNPDNQRSPPCWFVKFRDGNDRGKMRLWNLLSESEFEPPLPGSVNFHKVLDLTNFQIIELGQEFVGRHEVHIDHPLEPQYRDSTKKIALLWSNTYRNDFMILASFGYGFFAVLRSGEKEWTLIENVGYFSQDIFSFKGKFYAMDREGRTIVVDQSLNVNFLEQVGYPTTRKLFVQARDNLLTVEVLSATNSYSCELENVVGFRIFRLDEAEHKWDEVKSLEDQVLFLGFGQGICVSASEFSWDKGNLIFYSSPRLPRLSYSQDSDLFVFDFENGSCTPLSSSLPYRNLFWTPPEWVACTWTELETQVGDPVDSSPGSEFIRNSS